MDSSAICLACGFRSATTAPRTMRLLARQSDLDSPVATAFASYLDDADAADLGDVTYVRAAARLQVDAGNAQEPLSARTAGRLHAHRLHQIGPRIELFVADPHGLRFDLSSDQCIGLALDLLAIQQAHIDVEIEPCLLGRDVASGNRGNDDAGHDVERGMQTHERVPARPVDFERDGLANLRHGHRWRGHVQHAVDPVAFARIGDDDALSIRSHQRAGVARLSAAERIENRRVELDAALADGHDACVRGL